MTKNFILGTAQFNSNYGVNCDRGFIGPKNAQLILDKAKSAGFKCLDTAETYLGARNLLPKLELHEYKIITKIMVAGQLHDVSHRIEEALTAYKGNEVDILVHDPEKLTAGEIDKLFNTIEKLKASWHFRFGLSIYEPSMLTLYEKYFGEIEIVQAPCNVLDNRLLESNFYEKLLHSGVELHSRSAFLQGILLMDCHGLHKKLTFAEKDIHSFSEFIKANKIDRLGYCLWHAIHRGFDQTVLGVNSEKDLEDIVDSISTGNPIKKNYDDTVINTRTIDPRSW